METDAYEVEPWDFSPLSRNISAAAAAAAADFMHCCSLTHRNDSSASVEPVLLIQKPEASLALQTHLPRERGKCVLCTYVREGARPGGQQPTATKLGIYSTYSPRS